MIGADLKLRGIGPPHEKQRAVIDYLLEHSRDIKLVDVCAGRAWGKSEFAILCAFTTLLRMPGIAGLFLEPDWSRINKVFLRKWTRMIPGQLYTINKGERTITMINGSVLYYGARNVTGNKEHADDSWRGLDLAFVIDDEAAIGCSYEMYQNTLATIRQQSPVKYYLTISTFKFGDYELMIDSPGHRLFTGRTSDNPYLPPTYEAQLRQQMPPDIAARELDAERTSPEGRIWKYFEFEPWPRGNMLDGYSFRFGEPWYLAVDLGNHGAYQVYQTPPSAGSSIGGKLWCCVEEWTVNDQGGFESVLPLIIKRYCNGDHRRNKPTYVYLGHDANTKDHITSQSAGQILSRMGWAWTYPGGDLRYKDVQRSHLINMIYERRFVVAGTRDKSGHYRISNQHFGEGKNRGILEVMKRDTYPTNKGEIFTKDKAGSNPKASIEDDRDAALFGAVCWKHPDTYGVAGILRQ